MPDNPTQLQFDGRLTDVAVQYTNPELIGDLVLPPKPTAKKTGKYKIFNKDERFTVPSTKVGPKSIPNEVEWNTTEGTFTCEDEGLQEFLSNEDIENADAPITPMSDTVEFVMGLVMLAREQRTAQAVFDANNYATANKIDIAGAWATLSTDALTQLEVGIDACFVKPNVLVMGLPTWRKLSRNEKLLAAVKGTLAPQQISKGGVAAPAVNQQELAEYLGLDAVLVSDAKINTAVKGKAATYAPVWDGTNAGKGGAALLRTDWKMRDVVQLQRFEWKRAQVFTFDDTRGAFGGKTIRVVESSVLKSVATDVGYLFQDCLVT